MIKKVISKSEVNTGDANQYCERKKGGLPLKHGYRW